MTPRWIFTLATGLALALGASPDRAIAQQQHCKGCEGTRCLLGCPVSDLSNCGYNCQEYHFANGGAACISETGGCGYGLLGGDGSIVDPRRGTPAPAPALAQAATPAGLFRFAAAQAATPELAEAFVLRRPCDGAVVTRRYTAAAAAEKIALTQRIVL
ncbi:MAG TPA: hypothetical protein VFQ45_22920 [Longimicrobium sp.]|nr:hypothetical protein [Longimicrobium sp.]